MCHVRLKSSWELDRIIRFVWKSSENLLNRNLEHDALKFMRVAEFPPSNEDEKELAIRVSEVWSVARALYRTP